MAQDGGQGGAQLVGDRCDELVLDRQRAHQVGDLLVGDRRPTAFAVGAAHLPSGGRERRTGQRVVTDPVEVVVELLAPGRAPRGHLLPREARDPVGVVDVTELAGVTVVTVGERQAHRLLVAAVGPLVAAVGVDEQQPDVDGVEDGLEGAALGLELGDRALEMGAALVILADVEDLGDEVPGLAGVVAHERHREVAPHHAPVRAQVALEDAVAVDLPGQRPLELRQVGVEVVGVRDLLEGGGPEVLGVAVQHRARSSVDHHQPTVEVDQHHPDGGVLQRQPPQGGVVARLLHLGSPSLCPVDRLGAGRSSPGGLRRDSGRVGGKFGPGQRRRTAALAFSAAETAVALARSAARRVPGALGERPARRR